MYIVNKTRTLKAPEPKLHHGPFTPEGREISQVQESADGRISQQALEMSVNAPPPHWKESESIEPFPGIPTIFKASGVSVAALISLLLIRAVLFSFC